MRIADVLLPKGATSLQYRPRTTPFPDWAPNPDHYPTLKMDGDISTRGMCGSRTCAATTRICLVVALLVVKLVVEVLGLEFIEVSPLYTSIVVGGNFVTRAISTATPPRLRVHLTPWRTPLMDRSPHSR
jgi:hypothetical protein